MALRAMGDFTWRGIQGVELLEEGTKAGDRLVCEPGDLAPTSVHIPMSRRAPVEKLLDSGDSVGVHRGHFRSDLALSWTISHGGKQLTFHLRHGVRFSNGDPFDANAVRYTFQRALNPATKSPVTAGDLAAVRAVRVPDRYTVQLILETPSRPLLTALTSSYDSILDPRATSRQGTASCQDPIGTGPFKVSAVGPGFSSVTLVRNAYHTWETPAARCAR